ncbi:branched-chain amino acid ABC transporter permease [Staphylospora marina]|uniref:branched-chain amino acid ABC transporter permease n=1 Tax=Staphylospora marina TaxID=2490858 RepID=UPI000F5BFBA2|nr:branched-chain amino acid ABC transporter permease [Staphylospora marina]
MEEFFQFLWTGVTIGSTYAVVALGFVTIYSVSRVVNLAQGEFVMLGGMLLYTLLEAGLPLWAAAVSTVLLVALLGFLIEWGLVRRAGNADELSLIILTIGASIFLRGVASMIWGKDAVKVSSFTGDDPLMLGPVPVTPQTLWIVGTVLVLVILLYLFLEKTLTGKAFQAVASNRTAARLMGIRPLRMSALSFVISGVLGAAAGIVISPVLYPAYDVGTLLGVKGFSAAILGGLGNPAGAVTGGVLMGVMESFGAGYVDSGMKDAIVFAIVLIALLIRPQGLFGEKSVGKGGL